MATLGTQAADIYAKLVSGPGGTIITRINTGTITVANGATTGTATVTGLTTSAKVIATLNSATNAVYVTRVTPTADTVTVTLSGDPGAATGVVSYIAIETA